MFFVGFDYDALIQTNQWGSNAGNTNQWLGHEVSEGTEGATQVNGKWYIEGGADGYYSDWIVRIKEGVLKGNIRIIAEDLSASEGSDFDFNDVVFDVKYGCPQWDKTTIILQAAGGKLPLCIGQIDEAYEVHNLFGVSLNTMVNTEDWTAHKDPVTFVIDGQYGSWNIKDLPIYVKKGNDWCELKAEPGKAASKIGVPTTFKWVKELKEIEPIYTKFKEYVSNPSIEWWNTISDESLLYNAQ